MIASRPQQPQTPPLLSRREVLRASLAFAGIGGLAAVLAACGGPAAAPTTQGTATATAGPRSGGTLRLGVDQGPVGLDPNLVTSFSSFWVISAVYEPLVSLDASLRPQPGLAAAWETPDDRTYVFHLQPNATFHDGQPLQADDVVFTLQRIIDPKSTSPARSYLSAIDHVEAVDGHTVKVTLKAPYAPLLVNLANFNTSIVPRRAVQQNGDLQRTMIGTGPFKLSNYVQDSAVDLVRNPSYWRQGLPYLDGVGFRIIPQQQSLLAGLQSGSLDMALLSDGPTVVQAQRNSALHVLQTPSLYVRTLSFNVTKPPFDDVRVRQAIALAIQRDPIIQLAESGLAVPSGVLPVTMTAWALTPDKLPNYTADLARAKALLQQANAANLSFGIVCAPTYEGGQAVAEVIADQLKQVGVTAKLDSVEWGTYIDRWVKRDFQAMIELRSGPPDPDSYLYRMLYTKAPANNFGFSNPDLDRLLDQGRATADPQARQQVYQQVQTLVAQQVPVVMLYVPKLTVAEQPKVQGFQLPATGLLPSLRETWLGA